MSEPLARLYDLALRTLDDQERRADALRSRLGPVLAAAALGMTLLSGPLVGGEQPTSAAGKLALLVSTSGLFLAVAAAMAMLRTHGHTYDVEIRALAERIAADETLDLSTFYLTMISRLEREKTGNAALLDRLQVCFTAMLCGILLMLGGLALAAIVG